MWPYFLMCHIHYIQLLDRWTCVESRWDFDEFFFPIFFFSWVTGIFVSGKLQRQIRGVPEEMGRWYNGLQVPSQNQGQGEGSIQGGCPEDVNVLVHCLSSKIDNYNSCSRVWYLHFAAVAIWADSSTVLSILTSPLPQCWIDSIEYLHYIKGDLYEGYSPLGISPLICGLQNYMVKGMMRLVFWESCFRPEPIILNQPLLITKGPTLFAFIFGNIPNLPKLWYLTCTYWPIPYCSNWTRN